MYMYHVVKDSKSLLHLVYKAITEFTQDINLTIVMWAVKIQSVQWLTSIPQINCNTHKWNTLHCDVCGNGFSQSGNLNKHYNITEHATNVMCAIKEQNKQGTQKNITEYTQMKHLANITIYRRCVKVSTNYLVYSTNESKTTPRHLLMWCMW